jgi:selenide,water dikinase
VDPKKLTAHVKAGGCASKLSPKLLDQALAGLSRGHHPDVLVGFDTRDDAGVFRLTPDLAIVQTVDFFTPIVDDPYTYGAIAAANALSDVYAMGGKPVSAVSVLCFPGAGEMDVLREILRGGADKIEEAGCALLGGHSVADDEIKFGFAVTGTIHPDRILANSGARPGDYLVLTKSIGTGVISTALKRGIASDDHVAASIRSMLTLNRAPNGVSHGCTDITGFGLLGHSREMALASGVSLQIEALAIPFMAGAIEYAKAGAVPGGLKNNRDFVSSCVHFDRELPAEIEALLYDPQTSGGLLISTPEPLPGSIVIGRVTSRQAKPIHIV